MKAYFDSRLISVFASLGILPDHPRLALLAPVPEATDLATYVEPRNGRTFQMTPETLDGLVQLIGAARSEGLSVVVVSAFRSYEYQAALLRQRLEKGENLDVALSINAPPGFSEHHAGYALDFWDGVGQPLVESFETTPLFMWLSENAANVGWQMSFPRKNGAGFIYEPWHWKFTGTLHYSKNISQI